MPFNSTAMILAANTLRNAATYAQLHSAAAGDGTANVTTAARQTITWGAATSDGDFDIASQIVFIGGASGGPVYSLTLWSALTGGTCYGEILLSGDSTFNADGVYIVTSLAQNGAAT